MSLALTDEGVVLSESALSTRRSDETPKRLRTYAVSVGGTRQHDLHTDLTDLLTQGGGFGDVRGNDWGRASIVLVTFALLRIGTGRADVCSVYRGVCRHDA